MLSLARSAATAHASAVEDVRETVVRIRQGARPVADGEELSSTILLPALYERRQFQPAWTPGALDSLLAAIRDRNLDGLDPNDDHLAALLQRRNVIAGDDGARAASAERTSVQPGVVASCGRRRFRTT